MRTLDDVLGRCRVDEESGCWVWGGKAKCGYPSLYAPDYTRHNGELRPQYGRRAVWHIANGKAITAGWRVFGVCGNPLCLNPDHARAMRPGLRGDQVARSGMLKGRPRRQAANRLNTRKQAKTTPELIQHILSSREKGMHLARQLGISQQLVSRVRRGERGKCWQPLGGIFGALG
ncbi:MAG: hypothetical protein KGN37_17350 [Burkholderiales bacterium]|nr:hypothetical protein [Burkholderiales bacterium]